ncbi:hypothetical protein NKJ87_17835 [Mesorhizobium sp. M0027]
MDVYIPNDTFDRLVAALATAKSCTEQAIIDILMATRIWPASVQNDCAKK